MLLREGQLRGGTKVLGQRGAHVDVAAPGAGALGTEALLQLLCARDRGRLHA
jgi:hypothetical protein